MSHRWVEMLDAERLVDREPAGERARKRHRHHGDPGGRDAGIGGGSGIGADRADRIAETGAIDQQPDRDERGERQQEGAVQRRRNRSAW